jgi:hypothetical protein
MVHKDDMTEKAKENAISCLDHRDGKSSIDGISYFIRHFFHSLFSLFSIFEDFLKLSDHSYKLPLL